MRWSPSWRHDRLSGWGRALVPMPMRRDLWILLALLPVALGAARLPTGWSVAPLFVGCALVLARALVARIQPFLATGLLSLVAASAVSLLVSGWPWTVSWPRIAVLIWCLAGVAGVAGIAGIAASARRESVGLAAKLSGVTIGCGVVSPLLIAAPNERAAVAATAVAVAIAQALATTRVLATRGALTTARDEARGPSSARHSITGSGMAAMIAAWLPVVLLLWILHSAGSRGGWLAAFAGVGVVAFLSLAARGRRRLALYGAAALILGALAAAGTERGIDLWQRWASDGSPQGLRFEGITHGRPAIWDRARVMIAEAPVTGRGFGTFDRLRRDYYPLGFADDVNLEDAHQLGLQIWLDLGLLGLAGVGLILASTAARARSLLPLLRDTESRARDRAPVGGAIAGPVIGAVGAVFAYLVFGLADAVAFGSLGSLVFWSALGTIWAWPSPAGTRRRMTVVRAVLVAGLALILVAIVVATVALVLGGRPASSVLRHNVATVKADRMLAQNQTLDQTRTQSLGTPRGPTAWDVAEIGHSVEDACHVAWLAGWLARAVDGEAGRRHWWRTLLDCDARYLPMMAIAAPLDRELARHATRRHPSSAIAHAWSARVVGRRPDDGARANGARAVAIARWRRSLGLDPANGVGWRRLGDLLIAEGHLVEALDAFAASCTHGDPGANGCWLAGQLAEYLGDPAQASAFHARSRWSVARARGQNPAEALRHAVTKGRVDR